MTLQLNLPASLEKMLQTEVDAGVYKSIEDAIITKLIMADAPPFPPMTRDEIRADLEKAYNERDGYVDGKEVFERIREKSEAMRALGK